MKSHSIDKIIVTTNEWFTNEKYRRNGIDDILERGYEVEIWNMGKIVMPMTPDIPEDLYQGPVCCRCFETRRELKMSLEKCGSNVLFLNYYADFNDTLALSEAHVKYCNIFGAPMLANPWVQQINNYYGYKRYNLQVQSKMRRILSSFKHPKVTMRTIYKQVVIKKNPPIWNFLATPAEYSPICQMTSRDRIKLIHAMDFDFYLREGATPPENQGYIVFVDEGFGIHPEEKQMKLDIGDDLIAEYRSKMTKLFDELEQYFGIPVIIAAHPKSVYRGGEFGDREIYTFRTYELVKNCTFVIQHFSTITNCITYFQKPFLPVVMECFYRIYGQQVYNMARDFFGFRMYNMDDTNRGNAWEYIYYDEEKYKQYVDDFLIGDPTENRLFMEVVLDEIQKL